MDNIPVSVSAPILAYTAPEVSHSCPSILSHPSRLIADP